jgi:hemolysin activation/secretion protein
MKFPKFNINACCLSLATIVNMGDIQPLKAQLAIETDLTNQLTNQLQAQVTPVLPPQQDNKPPSTQPLPEPSPEPLPAPGDLLSPPNTAPTPPEITPDGNVPDTIKVDKFVVTGSTVFSAADFEKVTKPFTEKALTLPELFQARSAVTKLYVDKGYITSGAYIPSQSLKGGTIEIRVVEGQVEEVRVTGLKRLNPQYIRSRVKLAAGRPLNSKRLLQGLQVLQTNPQVSNLSAELSTGTTPGGSILEVKVLEAKTFNAQLTLDNGRSPSVGSFRREIRVSEGNLSGFGDGASVSYLNTDGSDVWDFSYSLPINAKNGTLAFSYGTSDNDIIEKPFNQLDITSYSRYYEVALRQPILQKPREEFALGFALTQRESKASLFNGEVPFPGSGTDENGRTSVTALRFTQEWTQRDSRQVFAARSQFSIGLDAFNSTINKSSPDSRFLAWRGQAQLVNLLAPDTLFLVRGDLQFADRQLLAIEQYSLGGIQSVRGYRQDALLTDNGFLASAEVRLPIWRERKSKLVLQVVPFIDFGTVWNEGKNPDPKPNTLVSTGLGLRFQLGDHFNAQLDYGIPLVSIESKKNNWQENGLYFSLIYSPF